MKRRRVFALSKIILRETDFSVTLGDGKDKKEKENAKLGRKICICMKIDSVETKCDVRLVINNHMRHVSSKGFLDPNFN